MTPSLRAEHGDLFPLESWKSRAVESLTALFSAARLGGTLINIGGN
jgi:hypothetical protein